MTDTINQPVPKLAVVHVVGGLHIIGRVTQMAEGIIIDKPFQIITFRTPNGQVAGGTLEAYGHLGMFRPFDRVPFSNIHLLHVVTENIPKQIEDQYLQVTTGIQLAKA